MAQDISVKLVLPSEVKLVELVHAATEKMAELAGFGGDEALNVGLAVREAVINAMVHGNRKDPQRSVFVTFTSDDKGLRTTILDQGNGFDRESAPDPRVGENRMRSSGRGLLLMEAFVDEVEFRRDAGGGTEVVMVKRRPQAQGDKKKRGSRAG